MSDVLSRAGRLVGRARVPGRLYDLGEYPGMSLSTDGHFVKGEIYEVHPRNWKRVIARLDEYEGCSTRDPEPHEYVRALVTAELPWGETLDVWAYILNRDANGLREITSGDYLSESARVYG